MKSCAHCQGRLGLGVRSRNFWSGHWWTRLRFCSTHCEALYELERRQDTSLAHSPVNNTIERQRGRWQMTRHPTADC
jgi:hypothetical protein